MLLKLISLVLALVISFSVSGLPSITKIQSALECIVSPVAEDYKLVAAIPSENIKLFALTYNIKSKDIYNRFLLSINGKKTGFNWVNVTNPTFSPKLSLVDVNNDGSKELFIILTTGTGTDVHMEDIHILQLPSLNEIVVDDPINIIKEKVHTEIINTNNEKVLITINTGNKTARIIRNKNFTPLWFDNVGFGSIIHWKISDNKLYTDIAAQVSPGGFVGIVEIEYRFKEGKVVLNEIKFIEKKQKS